MADDHQNQQPTEGHVLAGEGEDLLDVMRQRAAGALGIDHQADHRQQRRDPDALRQGGGRDRQQHERAAHGIGCEKVPE